MANDPFAAIRRHGFERSTSYAFGLAEGTSLPAVTPDGEHRNPQKTRDLPALPALPDAKTEAEIWRANSDRLEAETSMPRPWAEGVAAIELMTRPSGVTAVRWQQIIDDANVFCRSSHREAIETGWQIHDVFGFDLECVDVGLVLLIRAGRTVMLGNGSVVIVNGSTRTVARPGLVPPETPPIWAINKDRRRFRQGERHV